MTHELYEVRVEITVYVVAESEAEARREGVYAVKHGDESSAFESYAELLGDRPVSKDVARSFPYNAPRDRRGLRVEQWQSSVKEGKER